MLERERERDRGNSGEMRSIPTVCLSNLPIVAMGFGGVTHYQINGIGRALTPSERNVRSVDY